MNDNRIRIRISLNPENEEDLIIINYLESSNEKAQTILKKCILNHIMAEDEKKQVLVDLIKEEKDNKEKRKTRLFRKKEKRDCKQTEDALVKRYKVEEKNIEDYESLEKYAINKRLEPDVMAMMSFALDCGIDYKTILSMVENNLTAQQMRAVIDLIEAKDQAKRSKNIIIKQGKVNKNIKESKKDIKQNDPLAVEVKDLPKDIPEDK